jgi:hypothetical protein
MATSDRSSDDPAAKRRRRRPPPVLELKATEVGKGTSPRGADKKTDAPGRPGWNPWSALRKRLAAVDWPGMRMPVLAAGGIGAIAGAALVAIVVLLIDRGSDPRLTSLAGEVTALSSRIETLAQRRVPGEAGIGERIDKLVAAISQSERRLAAIESRPLPQTPDLKSVEGRTASIEATLKDLRAALADLRGMAEQMPQPATTAAVEALSGRIAGLENRIASLAVSDRSRVATSLAAELTALQSLNDAIVSGKPFAQELFAARALLGERAAPLAALEPPAAAGLPTIASLAQRFSALAPVLVRGPEPDGSYLTRLLANAVRLVEVRPVGAPEGAGVGAVVARTEAKLQRGDLAGALDEANSLPASAQAMAANWIAAAKERHQAQSAVKDLMSAILAAPAEKQRP